MKKLLCFIFYFTIGFSVYSAQSVFAAQNVCQNSLTVNAFDRYPSLRVNQYINLLLNQKIQFPHFVSKALNRRNISETIKTIKRQITLAGLLRGSIDMHKVLEDRSSLLTLNVSVLSNSQMITQRTLDLEFLQNFGSQLVRSLRRQQLGTEDEELSISILNAIQEILQKPYRALNPSYFISKLTSRLEDQDKRRVILHEFKTTGETTLLEEHLPYQLEGLEDSQFMLEGKRERNDYIMALRDIIASHERLNDLIALYIFSKVFHGTIDDFKSYLINMDESKLDALYDYRSQKKYIQEIIAFFPEGVRGFLYNTLMNRLQKLVKDIYKNAGTIQSVSIDQHLKLVEVHPYLGIFRGYVGSDCSVECAFGFPNDPNYRVFFILNQKGQDIGYVTGTKVFLPNGSAAFFINTINGLKVSGATIEIIFSTFSKIREELGVKEIVILGTDNQHTNLNYKTIRETYKQYRGEFVRISFEDKSRELRKIIASHTNSRYENPKNFEGANYLNDPNIDVHVDVEERSFGIFIPAEDISKKVQLWITLQNEKLAHQLQFNLDVSEIIGPLPLHQFAKNTEELRIAVYREKIEALFKTLSIEEVEKTGFELLFFEGMLNAPDAFYKEHVEKTREMLGRFKRMNQFNDSDLLLWAITKGYLRASKYLIDSGANIDAINEMDDTALMLAIKKSHTEIAILLINKGADIDVRVKKNHAERAIDRGVDSHEGDTALMLAIRGGHTEIAMLLIDKGANIDIQNNEDGTALMLASKKGHIEIVEFLIDKGVDIDIQNSEADTALMLAIKEGHIEIAMFLIDKGAELDIQNSEGDTALMLASREDYLEIVEFLIDKGVDMDIQNSEGDTALVLAIEKDHTEIAMLFIDKGADSRSDAEMLGPLIDREEESEESEGSEELDDSDDSDESDLDSTSSFD